VERELIRSYFQDKNGAGFDYAYCFPGMNRVLQAAGRVIRSETDHGVVLLLETRFAQERYRSLFPRWWHPWGVVDVDGIRETVCQFWHATESRHS
jgi:Rad3-related DNA helicase